MRKPLGIERGKEKNQKKKSPASPSLDFRVRKRRRAIRANNVQTGTKPEHTSKKNEQMKRWKQEKEDYMRKPTSPDSARGIKPWETHCCAGGFILRYVPFLFCVTRSLRHWNDGGAIHCRCKLERGNIFLSSFLTSVLFPILPPTLKSQQRRVQISAINIAGTEEARL